jgi:hypothetical protein
LGNKLWESFTLLLPVSGAEFDYIPPDSKTQEEYTIDALGMSTFLCTCTTNAKVIDIAKRQCREIFIICLAVSIALWKSFVQWLSGRRITRRIAKAV